MSPYVRTVKTSSGATAVQIVYSSRRGSRDIKHLGSAHSGAEVELLKAAAALAGGRVVTGGLDGRVLIWDPAAPQAGPAEVGRHDGPVWGVAALAGGRVVTGGHDRRVLIWEPARANTPAIQLSCSSRALATAPPGPAGADLVIAHQGSGISLWSFMG